MQSPVASPALALCARLRSVTRLARGVDSGRQHRCTARRAERRPPRGTGMGDFRAGAAELPGEVLAQSSVVAAAQVTQDVGEDARCGLYLVTPSRWRRSARQSSPPLSPGVIAGACVGGALLLAGVGALVASRRRSELGHEHALLGVSSHPGDQVLYTDNGALLGNGKSATTPRRRCL